MSRSVETWSESGESETTVLCSWQSTIYWHHRETELLPPIEPLLYAFIPALVPRLVCRWHQSTVAGTRNYFKVQLSHLSNISS